ncbi:MAG TPA: hypothetical protein VMT36_00675 [Candidatus Saccharimonadia bacterium]|nr:hypothetical protein [Candidatus Saccharimonadia bacterium]
MTTATADAQPPADRSMAPQVDQPPMSGDRPPQTNGAPHADGTPQTNGAPGMNGAPAMNGAPGMNGDIERGTTAAQLRRFIKSRPYVPLHELRRRFELNGECDDVTAMETPAGRCYIGLPEREGRFMADLVRQGEVGIELGHDPEVAIVVGVFPMRPVGR